jgi:hypothetical protein
METWTHNQIFLCCLASAALSGFATLLMSDKPINGRNILAYLFWFALAGTGTSMLGFEYLGGKEKPWRVIGSAIMVGMGVVKLTDLGPVMTRALRSMVGATGNGSHKNDNSNKDE